MQPRDSRIVTPSEAILRAHIRPRNAPRARAHAALQGHIRWGLIDRKGREVRGGEQSNLILNQGLDLMATYQPGADYWLYLDWQKYAAVGTGSTAPDVTDTGLVAEVARSDTTPDGSISSPTAGQQNTVVTKEFDFAVANGNLTEWGFAPTSTGNLAVRELFRDEFGDPVTITKTSDYKLRITYTLETTISPVGASWEAASFTITNIGLINGTHGFFTRAYELGRFWKYANGINDRARANTIAYDGAYDGDGNVAASGTLVITADAYIAGSYERTYGNAEWGTTDGNHAWASFYTGSLNGWAHGFLIDLADRFTKDDLHTLTIENIITVSWGRA